MGFPFLAAERFSLDRSSYCFAQSRAENRRALFLELLKWTTITHVAGFGCIKSHAVRRAVKVLKPKKAEPQGSAFCCLSLPRLRRPSLHDLAKAAGRHFMILPRPQAVTS
ncbi:hypothetical protein [Mesorhizobium silamurunense]|uniref:hypothetical protein n=1 Tax=Mesorhizobium silamurunense TaxID=499528 RepID=UPI00178563C5|nr:hypothetical protein [Mesorhizobium silamurunense]